MSKMEESLESREKSWINMVLAASLARAGLEYGTTVDRQLKENGIVVSLSDLPPQFWCFAGEMTWGV